MSHCPPLAVTSAVWVSSVEAREHVTCPGLHWTVKQQVAGTVILPQTSSKLTEIIILKRDYFKVASSLELFANQMKSVLMVRFQCKMFHFLKLLSQFRFSDWTMHLCLQRHCGRSQVRRWWQPLSSLADWLCARLGPLQGPELGLLEAEMSRVFGLGYSWPDTYSQCVFQTLLYTIQLRWVSARPPGPVWSGVCRQPYDKQQCRHLLSAQQEDTDDTDAGEEDEEDSDENILFVPEPYDDFTPEEAQLQLQTDNFDSQYDDEDEGAWLQLQNVSTRHKVADILLDKTQWIRPPTWPLCTDRFGPHLINTMWWGEWGAQLAC